MTDARVSSPVTTDPPRSPRRTWWVFGAVLTGVVLLASAATAGLWLWTLPSPEKTELHSEDFQRGLADVEVDVETGGVELITDEDGVFRVERESTWRGRAPVTAEEWVDDDSFEARADCDTGFPFDFGVDLCSVEYRMSLPSGTDVEARTAVADIYADGLDAAMRLESNAGAIEAERLRTTETIVESGLGDVFLGFAEVRADITVTTSVGNVTILVPDDGTIYEVRFESGAGERDVDIVTEPDADHVIRVSSGVGDLRVDYVS